MPSAHELRVEITAGREALRNAIEGAAGQWDRSPEGDEWSPRKTAEHALSAELHFASEVATATGQDPIEREEFELDSPTDAVEALARVGGGDHRRVRAGGGRRPGGGNAIHGELQQVLRGRRRSDGSRCLPPQRPRTDRSARPRSRRSAGTASIARTLRSNAACARSFASPRLMPLSRLASGERGCLRACVESRIRAEPGGERCAISRARWQS